LSWVQILAANFAILYPRIFWCLLSFIRMCLKFFRIFFPNILFTQVAIEKCNSAYLESDSNHQLPAALFFIHSFQLSGAESYALKCAMIAKSVGFKVIWVVDFDSEDKSQLPAFLDISDLIVYGWLAKSPLSEVAGLINDHSLNVKIIHLHHSVYGYLNISTIKRVFPYALAFDSTHVFELGGRGFPRLSYKHRKDIDLHNVISDGLERFFSERGVKNVVRTVISPDVVELTKTSTDMFTIKIIGRLCFQKRSYLIPMYIRQLSKALSDVNCSKKVEVQIVGGGIFKNLLIHKNFPSNIVVRFLDGITSKSKIYNDADLVVQLSENEGVSIVSYECAQMEVPILATDVGQQSESIHPDMLLPLSPGPCIKQAISKSLSFILHPEENRHIVDWQSCNLNNLTKQYDFRSVFTKVYADAIR